MSKDSLPNPPLRCQPPFPDIIPQYLPSGGLNLLAGAPGVGKTAFIAGLLRDLRDGRPIFGHQPNPVPALGFIGTDRSWRNGAGWWFEQVGFSEILAYSVQDDPSYNIKALRRKFDRTDILAGFIDRLKLPAGAAVVVDPIGPFLGGNLLEYDTCYVASQEIQRYLTTRQYTLIGTAHSAKQKVNKQDRYLRLQDRTLGSTALIGFGDTAMYLASPEELGKPYYAFHWQPHRAKAQTHYMERDANGLFIPYSRGDAAPDGHPLLALFPPATQDITYTALVEVAQTIPISEATVKRMLKALLSENAIVKLQHGLYRRVAVQ